MPGACGGLRAEGKKTFEIVINIYSFLIRFPVEVKLLVT